jgi:hypothetical protein
MNPKTPEQSGNEEKSDEGTLEKIAKAIDPPSTDVSDDELIDPGANIRDFPPKQNETDRNPSRQR